MKCHLVLVKLPPPDCTAMHNIRTIRFGHVYESTSALANTSMTTITDIAASAATAIRAAARGAGATAASGRTTIPKTTTHHPASHDYGCIFHE